MTEFTLSKSYDTEEEAIDHANRNYVCGTWFIKQSKSGRFIAIQDNLEHESILMGHSI